MVLGVPILRHFRVYRTTLNHTNYYRGYMKLLGSPSGFFFLLQSGGTLHTAAVSHSLTERKTNSNLNCLNRVQIFWSMLDLDKAKICRCFQHSREAYTERICGYVNVLLLCCCFTSTVNI